MAIYITNLILTSYSLALLVAPGKLIAFEFEVDQRYLGDKCTSSCDNLSENGICTLIEKCPLAQMKHNNYTVCGYEGVSQVICCPTKSIIFNLTLSQSVNCNVTGMGEHGVIKFKSDCNHLDNRHISAGQFCDHDICKDLVCCPTKLSTRVKQVCPYVDMPENEVTLRLHLNQECLVKDTNLTGRYQTKCDYATRNPHMEGQLRNVCNDESCDGWYCCPIEEPHDKYHCNNKLPLPNVKIVGPQCTDSRTGLTGRCRSMDDCFGFAADEIVALERCGDHCCLDYYCCPDSIQNVANQPLAIQKCWEYSKYVNKHEIEVVMDFYKNRAECGSDIKPVGGQVVEPGEYPHMAALGYELDGAINWNCGGSLISDEYVLTAAHCLVNNSRTGVLNTIQLGVLNIFDDIETLDCPEFYNITETIRHPDYISSSIYNDIGLIQLNRKVKFNFHIRPICLPSSVNLPKRYKSMGWGDLGFLNGTKADKLLKVDQDLYSHDECQAYYSNSNSRKMRRGILNETQMCAIRDVQGTCAGDSGGPLLANHPKMERVSEIYGIVSFGADCSHSNTPGIYTKVYPYKEWIERIVFRGPAVF